MAKLVMLILGLLLLGAGIFLAFSWWEFVVVFLSALLVCFLVIAGLIVIVLAIGEITSRTKK